MAAWRPIETAPWGVGVLLACSDERGGYEICAGIRKHEWRGGQWVASGTEETIVWVMPIAWMPAPEFSGSFEQSSSQD